MLEGGELKGELAGELAGELLGCVGGAGELGCACCRLLMCAESRWPTANTACWPAEVGVGGARVNPLAVVPSELAGRPFPRCTGSSRGSSSTALSSPAPLDAGRPEVAAVLLKRLRRGLGGVVEELGGAAAVCGRLRSAGLELVCGAVGAPKLVGSGDCWRVPKAPKAPTAPRGWRCDENCWLAALWVRARWRSGGAAVVGVAAGSGSLGCWRAAGSPKLRLACWLGRKLVAGCGWRAGS